MAIGNERRINFWELRRGRGTLAYAAVDFLWVNRQPYSEATAHEAQVTAGPRMLAGVGRLVRRSVRAGR